jgi:hypothetical protein
VTRGHSGPIGPGLRLLVACAVTALTSASPYDAWGASFAAKDLQILGRAVAFMQPAPPPDAVVAIAYAAGNAASRQDADAIAALIGGGLPAGHIVLRPRVVDVNGLEAGGFHVVIAAAGADGPRLNAAARAARALCVTTDVEAVRSGLCAMAITSEPRVKILVNHEVSAAAGIDFATAFRMMIQEM